MPVHMQSGGHNGRRGHSPRPFLSFFTPRPFITEPGSPEDPPSAAAAAAAPLPMPALGPPGFAPLPRPGNLRRDITIQHDILTLMTWHEHMTWNRTT